MAAAAEEEWSKDWITLYVLTILPNIGGSDGWRLVPHLDKTSIGNDELGSDGYYSCIQRELPELYLKINKLRTVGYYSDIKLN